MYRIWYTCKVAGKPQSSAGSNTASEPLPNQGKRVPAVFSRTSAGGEPVRDWLKALPSSEDRKRIGADIKTVEFGWPLGMPVCRPLPGGIYEVRTRLEQNRIARILFYIDAKGRMVLLHRFDQENTRRRPDEDLALAKKNKSQHRRGLQ